MSLLLDRIRAGDQPIIGMVQLGPLPGSSRYRGGGIEPLLEDALAETEALMGAGVDALMVQNLGDLPVDTKVTSTQIAWTVRIASAVREASGGVPVGLNFLENDAHAMLTVASASGLDFIRIKIFVGVMVTPFGLETAAAYEAQKARGDLDADNVTIFADVHDRTGVPLADADLAEDIDFAIRLGGCDGLVLTGKSYAQSIEFLKTARAVAGDIPLLIGGGADADNIGEILAIANGAIVSSSLKPSGTAFGRIDPAKAQRFMQAVALGRKARAGN